MARTKIVAGLVLALLLSGCSSSPKAIRVGSKNFTEQMLLGEIIAQHLEKRLQQSVERRSNLGGTLLAQQALTSGQIDVYPEYTGTALAAVLKLPMEKDPARVLETVRSAYRDRFNLEWLEPLGIDNSFAMVIGGEEARRRNLETLSDAAKVAEPWALGVGYEFEQRPDGMAALTNTYGLRWKGSPKSMDLGLLYRALDQNQVSMIAANATDGLLSAKDLKVLRDDQRAFPPYQVCVIARQEALREAPGLREALGELAGRFTNEEMQKLNYQVDAEHRPVREVASAFLKQQGLQ